jgi:hypothetical protein
VTGVLDVAAHKHCLAAFRLNELLGGARILILFEVGNQKIGTFTRIGDGDGAADAAVAAGDDGPLAFEPA